MAGLYTKNGRPLRVSGKKVYGPSGRQVGQIRGRKVYGPNGRYVGTIVGERLIHRPPDSASVASPFAPSLSSPSAAANRAANASWGDEPPIDD